MVKFNQLFVTPSNKGIYIDISVLTDMPYFDNVYLDEIIIDTQETFKASGPSASPVCRIQIGDNKKDHKCFINANQIITDMEGKIFFVYVKTKGDPRSDTPCGLDCRYTLGACADLCKVYRNNMLSLKEIKDTCTVSKDFINFILLYKAFEMSFRMRDFQLAINYWNELNGKITQFEAKKCACNG